jgi:hypothetical protein
MIRNAICRSEHQQVTEPRCQNRIVKPPVDAVQESQDAEGAASPRPQGGGAEPAPPGPKNEPASAEAKKGGWLKKITAILPGVQEEPKPKRPG